MILQIPDYIRNLVPYIPGKPIEETQREFGIKKVVKLASNENPLGASPKARRAIQDHLKKLHRYPDGGGFYLKAALSKMMKISPSSFILGNGSNEVIDHLIRTYCIQGDAIAIPQASFVAYKISAQVHGVETLEAPLNLDLKFDIDSLVDLVRKNSKVRLVFVANPNNPTGQYLSLSETQRLLQGLASIRGGTVLAVLDYAYWEYVTDPDLPAPEQLLRQFPNLVILRTFSKIYGLAGLRVGYGMASPEIIAPLEKVRQPFNVSSLALAGAEAALQDVAFVKKAKLLNRQGMKFWETALSRMGIPYWESQGNFLLANVGKGMKKAAMEVYQSCLAQGVIFRPTSNYQMPHDIQRDILRISIGTAQENERAVKVLSHLQKAWQKA